MARWENLEFRERERERDDCICSISKGKSIISIWLSLSCTPIFSSKMLNLHHSSSSSSPIQSSLLLSLSLSLLFSLSSFIITHNHNSSSLSPLSLFQNLISSRATLSSSPWRYPISLSKQFLV